VAVVNDFHTFLHEARLEDFPDQVIAFGRRCLLDLLGVGASGSQTQLSAIIRDHASDQFAAGGRSASILFDGRKVSPAGAALANGMTIDAIDAHDGCKPTKGHVGCHVFPALLALCEAEARLDGSAFLAALIVGYEIGSRAGTALHATAPDYHTSGAWGAVACAALGARILGLDYSKTREAIGIAEYHGPRSQMMRCIDHPTMVKDGSGWGAMAGVSAAYLARDGFTGAPALTVEGADAADHWQDLGTRWCILEQYFKPHPVCRWAQPAVEAALSLVRMHALDVGQIERIEVVTFHEGCRLAVSTPQTTEQAQYSLPFPVAAALVKGRLGPSEIQADALHDDEVLRLSQTVTLTESDAYNAVFPEQRYAHVAMVLRDGTTLVSERHSARGDPENHLSDEQIQQKFVSFASPVLGEKRTWEIIKAVDELGQGGCLNGLLSPITGH